MASSRSSKAVHSEVERHSESEDHDSRSLYDNVRCSELRVKDFVLIGGRPCKIMELSSSKTGKHGSCKIHLVAIDVFTGKKRVTAYTSTEVVQVPQVAKRECRLLRIIEAEDQEDSVSARLEVEEKSGGSSILVRPCQDKAEELLEASRDHLAGGDVIVTIMSAMSEEAVVAVRRSRDRGSN